MLAIPRKQRAMVRKGIKAGLVSAVDDDLDRFFALYADNVHRHGTPAQSRRYFETLKDDVRRRLPGADGRRRRAARAVSSVLSFCFRDEVLPYYAGDARRVARDRGERLQVLGADAARRPTRGLTLFDYGRSKVGTGPYDFKRNWGFDAAAARPTNTSSSGRRRCRRTIR